MFYSRPKIDSSLNPHSLLIAPYLNEYFFIHKSWFLTDFVSSVSNHSDFVCLKSLKFNFPSCQLDVDSLFIDPPPFHPFLHLPPPPPLSEAVLSIPNKRLPIYLPLGILIDTIKFGLF